MLSQTSCEDLAFPSKAARKVDSPLDRKNLDRLRRELF